MLHHIVREGDAIMLFGKREKKRAPQTDEEILQEAFAGVKGQQKTRGVRKRRSNLWAKYADKRILWVLGLAFVVLIGDAVRRENMEFYAVVSQVTGTAQVRLAANGQVQAIEERQRLEDGGEVSTGPQGSVVLSFPDGSVITLAPNTRFQVHLLEYNRGGMWRGRSFTLLAGRMWASVSDKFGADSRCKIHTPSSVAAVRGTKFYVMYDPGNKLTQVACNEGAVRVDGFRGRPSAVVEGSTTTVAYGKRPEQRMAMAPGTRDSFRQRPLIQPVEPDGWLKTVELRLTCALDPLLTVLGIGKAGWAFGATESARRTAALEALRKIHFALEGNIDYPEFVDPYTMKELSFEPEDALRILGNLDGCCLEKYDRISNGFVIYARARDRARTPYKVTTYGVQAITEDEMP